jgi:hypothetical protein
MPCMCGDTHCPSCGPAQGNSQCPLCGAWLDDGCAHFNEETGFSMPEFQAAFQQAEREQNEIFNEQTRDAFGPAE